jgi:cell division protein FtsI (penicillin-binding protein 3)
VRGWRFTQTDRRKQELVALREQEVEPRAGLNAVLTLDMVIQNIVETELAEAMKDHSPVSASGLVVRPRTGEILAMATLPHYNPNRPGDFPDSARRNRIITDVVEPGSTFKIVVVSAALNEDLISLSDTLDCEQGSFHFMGKVLRDHERYGVLTVENIITKSSNIGAAKIGIKMGEQRLYDYIRAFGFGTRTGIALPGEVNGIVHPVARWDKLSISRIPMGQAISVTPLQMVMAMCAIANDGRLMQPMLVRRLQEQNSSNAWEYTPQMVRQVISRRAARDMVTALKTVVSPQGTAPKAILEHYTVAGKTGTAQKAAVGGYSHDRFVASFIGFFPADAPDVCIAVFLDEPQNGYYGGQTAAPIFKRIAEPVAKYLSIRPDREESTKVNVAGIVTRD